MLIARRKGVRAVFPPLGRPPRARFRKRRLEEATVQELHLELIRRTQHNAFDGEKITASLLAHRDLWQAVIFTRLLVFGRGHEELPVLGFVTLRDLPENYWNADTLYILTKNVTKARQLQRVTRAGQWAGEVSIFHNSREVNNTLGAYDRQAICPCLVGLNVEGREGSVRHRGWTLARELREFTRMKS